MSDIYAIAKSGLKAYKEGLATTGQNIANVGNEAYSRREITLNEVKSGSPDALHISDNISFGVKVDGITRAFDKFIEMQLHDARSGLNYSKAQVQIFDRLENIVKAGEGGVSQRINEFFQSLSEVAQDPSALASRFGAIESAKGVAQAFRTVATGLNELKGFLTSNIDDIVLDANLIISQLTKIQKEILGNTNSKSTRNELFDQRDALISKLSELINVEVQYKSSGEIQILSGTVGQGQPLLSGIDTKIFSVQKVDGKSKIYLSSSSSDGSIQVNIKKGKIAGFLSADAALGETKKHLDDLATKVAREINELHQSAIDLDGTLGTKFFTLDNVDIVKNLEVDSNTQLHISGFSDTFSGSNYSLLFESESETWRLHDSNDLLLARFAKTTEINGVVFSIKGEPVIGDQFNISFTNSNAEDIQVLLNDPRKLAASRYRIVVPGGSNQSLVQAKIGEFITPSVGDIPDLTTNLNSAGNSANPAVFRNGGVLGVIENANDVNNLANLKTQTRFQSNIPFSSITVNSQLKVTVGGVDHTFTFGAAVNDISDYGELSKLLNSGVIKTDATSQTFKELGLYAGGNQGKIIVSSAFFPGASSLQELTAITLNGLPATKSEGTSITSGLQVFTREGVQIAGKPLSDSQVFDVITEENGFNSGAEYTAEHLALTNHSSYLGASVSRVTTTGNYVARMSSLGRNLIQASNFTVGDMTNLPSSRLAMASPLNLTVPTGKNIVYQPSQGMTAGHIATALNTELAQHGISVRASNLLELYDLPDQLIQFDLKGDNAAAANVIYDLRDGNVTGLVSAINEYAEETGITAYSAAHNRSIILEHSSGNDISLENVQISNSAEIRLRQIDEFGEVVVSPENSSNKVISSGKFAQVGGQLTFIGSADFSMSIGNEPITVQTSEFESGFIKKEHRLGSALSQYSFKSMGAIDSAGLSADGLNPVAPSGLYTFNISSDALVDLSASFHGTESSHLTNEFISTSLAKTLRANAPKSHFYGNAFTLDDGFPQNGSRLEFRLGDQYYEAVLSRIPQYDIAGNNVIINGTTYTKVDGLKRLVSEANFEISGEETDRLSVGFIEENDRFKLKAVAVDGTISGHALRLSSNNSIANLNNFHIDSGVKTNSSARIYGKEFNTGQNSAAGIAKLVVGNTEISIDFVKDNPSYINHTPIAGVTIEIEETNAAANLGVLLVSIDQTVSDQNIRLKATNLSSNFGVVTASTQLTLNDEGFALSNHASARVTTSATVESLASEIISIHGLGGEDLLVLSDGNVRPSLIGSVDTFEPSLDQREIIATIASDDGKTVMLHDKASGDYLGRRQLNDTNELLFRNYEWKFDGPASLGDTFELVINTANKDDGSNLHKMIELASVSDKTGKGGYSEIYTNLIVEAGYKSSFASQSYETNEIIHEVALDRKSEFSGVDLDTEAAKLIEQQQAYQALAKVLSTAKELVDTLLRSF